MSDGFGGDTNDEAQKGSFCSVGERAADDEDDDGCCGAACRCAC